jgi:hypothetical protein
LDRDYPAFWIFKLITNVGSNFCARISDHHWSVVKAFKNSGQMEDTLTFTASCPARKACRELGLNFKPIKLRLVRVALDTGETEILITSLLDRQSYPHDCFAELYHHRWPVEEDYNHMKHRLEIENFTGKSPLTVYQDFHAKVLTKNLAAILAHSGQELVDLETATRKHKYQVNFTQLLSKAKDTVILFFQHDQAINLIRNLLEIAAHSIEPVRPGRTYPRNRKVSPSRFRTLYKPIR